MLTIPWIHVYTMTHVYTMIPFIYVESMSVPWLHIYAMSLCLYHESMCIHWVNASYMHPWLYHASLLITFGNVYNMSPEMVLLKKKKIHKYNFKKKSYRNTELQKPDIQKYKLHKYRNTNGKYAEIMNYWWGDKQSCSSIPCINLSRGWAQWKNHIYDFYFYIHIPL